MNARYAFIPFSNSMYAAGSGALETPWFSNMNTNVRINSSSAYAASRNANVPTRVEVSIAKKGSAAIK
jgi:SH3-like domain-containing protein